jgi:anti-sigma B factor antagonist
MKAFSFQSRPVAETEESLIFELRGYIDAHTVLEFERAIQASIESGTRKIVLDIGGLSYISSAGIGAMMGMARKLTQAKGDMVLLNPTQKVYAILDGLGFTRIFKISDNLQDALTKVGLESNEAIPPSPSNP